MFVTIAASDVAAALGLNPFRTPEEYMEILLRKYRGDISVEAETIPLLGLSEIARDLKSQNYTTMSPPELKQLQETILGTDDFLDANDYFEKNEHEEVIKRKKKVIESISNRRYGTDKEDTVVLRHTMDGSVIDKDSNFYKYPILVIKDVHYQIIGRIDRIETNPDGERLIVEIKNRIHRLFLKLRDYERIQCLVYLQLVPNCTRCRLIESYGEKTHEEIVSNDEDLWETDLLPKLKEFCQAFHESFQQVGR